MRSLRRVRVTARLSPAGVRALPSIIDDDIAVAALDQAGPPGPDGWTEVELALEEPEIAAGQLLGLGVNIEILEPAAVRAAFADTTRRMAERHQ
jgi:predicted DNA-binding transcriptional regulator YafY